MANGNQVNIVGTGTAILSGRSTYAEEDIKLFNTLYIPDLKENLNRTWNESNIRRPSCQNIQKEWKAFDNGREEAWTFPNPGETSSVFGKPWYKFPRSLAQKDGTSKSCVA